MTPALVIDIISVILIVVSFVRGSMKGFIKSVWRLAAWVITAVLTFSLLTPAYEFALNLPASEKLNTQVHQYLDERLTNGNEQEAVMITGLPEFLGESIDLGQLTSEAAQNFDNAVSDFAKNITNIIIKIAVFILLFLIIRILLWLVFNVLNVASKLPVIKGANKLLGGIAGVLGTMFVIYLVCAFISFFASNAGVIEVINSSYIVKYFYNNNILLQLAFGI